MKLGQLWLACAMGVVILGGVKVDRAVFQVPAGDSYPYHARVRAAAESMPMNIGDWHGADVEVPTAAQKLLRSNLLISREYTNQKNGEKASFLLVQCGDARDLVGHYPPVCYPNAGYTLVSTTSLKPLEKSVSASVPGDLSSDLFSQGTLYQFTQDTLNGTKAMWVFNVMILPDNQTAPSMDGVYRIARNRRMRYFGAAEIQVLTTVGMGETERSKITNILLGSAAPLVEVIRSGVVQ